MKIERVQTHVLDYRLDQAFESASMRFERRQHCLVEIVCDDGTVGWGECLGPARANATIVGLYADALVGADPLETEKLWLDLYHRLRDQGQRGLTMTALSGIDIALWDIKGKRYGAPVSELLGGRFREEIRAYATGSFRRDGVDRVQDVAEEVAGHAREGFHGVKIKIGFDVEEDLRVIAAVREAIGPERRLMIDANHGYDVLEAIEVGKRAERFGIDWFEEPVLPEQLEAYRAVRQGQPIPVASGENWHGRYAMLEPLATRAVDIVQPDVCGVGGVSEMRRVADMAAMFGVRLVPHVWGTAVCIAASLQSMAALPPNPPRRRPIEPIMEFDRTTNPFRQAVVEAPLEHRDGVMRIPDGPGLGIAIDRDALQRFALVEEGA
ncbi:MULTISPECIES: mandelate racemase/muconate lactonizing enzyme family protein [Halomonas]|uniref:D-galactarolactone cycloisomerase n=1 Tax=Halomonas halophila TaxID=29573 RepID=A0ABQ0U7K0_9GAMM|nr:MULTISPECIES: mandelate racemase/muconate lactonizing enzyme family protein [Halomonas]MDR5891039.1 mandelate racemase/muconate lactonizing enzyme family protein [Halomonas salina]WJY06551.1 mandelate racemase/muconate lactonizing enzyme family protein [Halomonas halophila]GEK74476.1 D-galactarolactone cycloisomerase [Halomonas halophila]